MKKRFLKMISILLAALLLAGILPQIPAPGAAPVYADEETDKEKSEEEKARDELLEKTYKIEVASNKIDGWPQGPGTYGEAACVMDMDTGAILYDKKMNSKQYPASITKVMTAYVTCKYGDLDSQVSFCEEDVSFLEGGDASLGMHPGEVITMKDAMYGMLLHSANEVSHAIIRTVGAQVRAKGEIKVEGAPDSAATETELDYQWGIALMNMEAKAIGCTGSHFVNSYGLHDDNHYVTAHDMCLIGAAAYQYDFFKTVTQTLSYVIPRYRKDEETDAPNDQGLYTIDERWMKQNHKMLHPDHEKYFDVVTGGKTGFTDQAGTTLVTLAEKDGKRLVCTCLHTYGAANVYDDTRALLNYGFDNFDHLELAAEDISLIAGAGSGGIAESSEEEAQDAEKETGDGSTLSSGKDEEADGKAQSRGVGRKITMMDTENVLMTVPKGASKELIWGKASYDMDNFDLNKGILQLMYKETPVGQIDIYFESFQTSMKNALAQARKVWHR